jgi:aspartyl-tRNA(Asn)/glutamyl-tRNA(Gln) amidotransferase subunit C
MVEVNEKLTRQVAELARLELSDQEVQLFTSQLGEVLKYIDQLQSVDVSGVEPLTHALDLVHPLREDVIKPSPVDAAGKPKVLSSAPDVMYDGFKVPPIL